MQARIYLVPVATRINWEGCVRKGIRHKLVGMAEMEASISLDGVAVHLDCWCICCIFILDQKIQKMAKCIFWYQLTQVVPDKVQRAVKSLCVCLCVSVLFTLYLTSYLLAHNTKI